MNEKIEKIIDIFNKYGFALTTNNDVNVKEKVIQEMLHSNLDEIADCIIEYANCIKDIMKVVYDKE